MVAEGELLRHRAGESEKLRAEIDRQAMNFQEEARNIRDLYEQKQRAF